MARMKYDPTRKGGGPIIINVSTKPLYKTTAEIREEFQPEVRKLNSKEAELARKEIQRLRNYQKEKPSRPQKQTNKKKYPSWNTDIKRTVLSKRNKAAARGDLMNFLKGVFPKNKY
jgi:hypothetical protein